MLIVFPASSLLLSSAVRLWSSLIWYHPLSCMSTSFHVIHQTHMLITNSSVPSCIGPMSHHHFYFSIKIFFSPVSKILKICLTVMSLYLLDCSQHIFSSPRSLCWTHLFFAHQLQTEKQCIFLLLSFPSLLQLSRTSCSASISSV